MMNLIDNINERYYSILYLLIVGSSDWRKKSVCTLQLWINDMLFSYFSFALHYLLPRSDFLLFTFWFVIGVEYFLKHFGMMRSDSLDKLITKLCWCHICFLFLFPNYFNFYPSSKLKNVINRLYLMLDAVKTMKIYT